MYELSSFDSMQIGIASPEKIREWSHGEVLKPETINYRTLKPERDGLFCEKIFGPTRDWECHCGRYKRIRYKGVVCEKCGVEVTKAKVRRERMGHIELAAPVSHIWYFRGVPSRISLILDMSAKELERVIYFQSFVVLDPGKTNFVKKQVIDDKEYLDAQEQFGYNSFRAVMGAEAVKELLMEVDLEADSKQLKDIIANSVGQKRIRAVKRLEIVEAFRISGNKPSWMILDVLPVLPPDLRPMVQLDGGRFATSDLNDLYRRVINRNNRLKRLKEMLAPDIIIRNEKRMLQEAVDALIDNGRRGKAITGAGNRDLKSLSSMLRGKQGRFRQNLLGKRVDYSGRSVIVVGPELKLYQCGLPKEMALELFKPFVMKKLVDKGICLNIKAAKRFVDSAKSPVWDILEDVIKDHPVLLNRAPTLHRLGIQAFEPVLVEGRAIKLHPLSCGAFNADFDGDQMPVHVPLSIEAQAEARILMLSTNNILKLSDGRPIVLPTQDMVIGSYYLTIVKPGELGEGKVFKSPEEALMAYADGVIRLQSLIYIRIQKEVDGVLISKRIHTTVGRYIFNEALPQDLKLLKRTSPDSLLELEVDGIFGVNASIDARQLKELRELFDGVTKSYTEKNQTVEELAKLISDSVLPDETCNKARAITGKTVEQLSNAAVAKLIGNAIKACGCAVLADGDDKKVRDSIQKSLGQKSRAIGKSELSKIVDACFKYKGATATAEVLDKIKALGFKFSTIGAITTSLFDMHIPKEKNAIISAAEEEVVKIEKKYRRGMLTEDERYRMVVNVWTEAAKDVEAALKSGLDEFNPIWMMANSGARGSMGQIRQLAGMRGLMADPTGRTIELPVKANFREGLSVLEYFISSHGGRKGLADTALKTADSGYLTRRLVDVSQDIIVREQDCGDRRGAWVEAIINRDNTGATSVIESLADRINGRYTIDAVVHPETGEIIVDADTMISPDKAEEIEKSGITRVLIRSVLNCKSRHGVCSKCYGKNMASGNPVKLGEAVGIIAAQSIGEPGTQLTMRTFHTGGVASGDDITQGLPRVAELFEARKPKGQAVIAKIKGVVKVDEKELKIHVIGDDKEEAYQYVFGAKLKVKNGDAVEAGEPLTNGPIDPKDILEVIGVQGVQNYLIREVQTTYKTAAGVQINDKHIEVIIRQMLRKVRIEDQGDTDLLPGTLVDIFTYEDEGERVNEEGGMPATAKRTILGITKAALATESFLSAASFQETAKVLTEAAIKNKIDPLLGLKENVIIGKLIPAGTGMKIYKNINTAPVAEPKIETVDPTFAVDYGDMIEDDETDA